MDKSLRLLAKKKLDLKIRSCTYAIHDVPSKPIRRASDRLGGCGGWSTVQIWRMKSIMDPILSLVKCYYE